MVWRRTIGVGPVLLGVCAMSSASRGEDAPVARSGMKAHVDPQTGRLVPEPVVPPPSRPRVEALPVAEEPARGGGMMARLKGRFTSRLVRTVEADGTVPMEGVTDD